MKVLRSSSYTKSVVKHPRESHSGQFVSTSVLLSVGECQQIVRQDDQVLFAHANCSGNNRTKTYLRPYGPTSAVRGNVTLTVTDWRGVPVGSVPVKETAGRTNPERHRYEWEGDVRS